MLSIDSQEVPIFRQSLYLQTETDLPEPLSHRPSLWAPAGEASPCYLVVGSSQDMHLVGLEEGYPFGLPSLIYAKTSTDLRATDLRLGLKAPENFTYRHRHLVNSS